MCYNFVALFSASRIKEVLKSWKIEDDKERALGVSSRGTQEIIILGPFILSLRVEINEPEKKFEV